MLCLHYDLPMLSLVIDLCHNVDLKLESVVLAMLKSNGKQNNLSLNSTLQEHMRSNWGLVS